MEDKGVSGESPSRSGSKEHRTKRKTKKNESDDGRGRGDHLDDHRKGHSTGAVTTVTFRTGSASFILLNGETDKNGSSSDLSVTSSSTPLNRTLVSTCPTEATTSNLLAAPGQDTLKKRSKWRKSSSWSPNVLQEEIRKMGAQEASPVNSPLAKAGSSKGSRGKKVKGDQISGGTSDSSWTRVPEAKVTESMTGAVTAITDSEHTSSIVLELRKMKELKKQEEEAASKDKKGKKKTEKKKTKKKRANDSIVLPSIIEKALTYIEQNHQEVDQMALSDELTALQKKVFKILKDALDSDLKQAHKSNSSGSGLSGSFVEHALSPRGEHWGYSTISAGTRIAAAASINTLSALKKDDAGEWIVDFSSYDLTCAISFLKYFLTEQQLIPDPIYAGLCAAVEIQFQSFRLNEMHSLLSRLPQINLLFLKRILMLLAVISKNATHKLTIGRVATSFATVVLAPSHLEVSDIRVQRKDISVLRELIMNYDGLFTANQHLQFIEREGKLLVRYATLSKIVEKLVDESYSESEFADIVFLTHSYFTPAPALLTGLINIHNDNNRMPTIANKNWQHRIRLRVLRLILDWVSGYPDEIITNRDFTSTLQEFILDKPAGLLGKRSLIPEEANIFVGLEKWVASAQKTQAELAAKAPEADQVQEQSATAESETKQANESLQSTEEIEAKASQEDSATIPEEETASDHDDDDDDLTGSDIELKFTSEDEDDEDEDSDEEATPAQSTPVNRKLSFTLAGKEASTSAAAEPNDGNTPKRMPPMLGQMKRGPQMMSSSDFFNILAKGTQVMMTKEPSLSSSGLSTNQVAKSVHSKAADDASKRNDTVEDKKHQPNAEDRDKKVDGVNKTEPAEQSKANEPTLNELKKEEKTKAKDDNERKGPKKESKKSGEKKLKKKPTPSAPESENGGNASDAAETQKKVERRKKFKNSKSAIAKTPAATLPKALPSRALQSDSDFKVTKQVKKADSPGELDSTNDKGKLKKSLSGEKKVKKSKKSTKRKYQTLKKLSGKKKGNSVAESMDNSKQTAIEGILSAVDFSPAEAKETTLPTGNPSDTIDDGNSKIEKAEISGETHTPASSGEKEPLSSQALEAKADPRNDAAEVISTNLDTVDRDEILERIKDRTDIESRLLVHLINKEKQLEREVDSLRKAVERLLVEKVERNTEDISTGASAVSGSGKKSKGQKNDKIILEAKTSQDSEPISVVGPVSLQKDVGGGSGFQIFFMDHVALAKELTLRDSRIFHAIEARELLHKRFMTPEKSPTFQRMVQSFNQIADWVLAEVLRYETPADRGNAITAFIRICDQLWTLKNFNMLFAVLGGLDRTPVRRLKLSWKKVPAKERKIFKKQMTLTDTEKNNAIYRHALRRAKPPLVPYLALFSKDLFSLDEGVPTMTKSEGESGLSLINFDKLRLLYQLIKEFRQLQQTLYTDLEEAKGTSSLQALLDITPPLDEKAAYNLSYQWEPRQAQA